MQNLGGVYALVTDALVNLKPCKPQICNWLPLYHLQETGQVVKQQYIVMIFMSFCHYHLHIKKVSTQMRMFCGSREEMEDPCA